jgi:cyclohexanone monooxygenase
MTLIASESPTPGCLPTDTPDDVDIPALRDKYRAEHDKRLRADGSTQYLELSTDFAAYSEVDPHTPFVERDALSIETDVLILGGGFAGLLTAVALKKAGVADILR